MSGLTLNVLNPFSGDFFWWQVGKKLGQGATATSTGIVANALAPDWFFWGTSAAVLAGGVVLYRRQKKGRRR